MTFDPDQHQRAIDAITPEAFAVVVTQYIVEHPHSMYWNLVSNVIEIETGWQPEHEQVQAFINRIADDQPISQ